ncbi:MAG: PIN domain-containing protein [Firmicutes bacterium]|nr:PIN domain-containing protein [Bacillota bacterium]
MMVFVDTSAWVSLIAKKDPYHEEVARKWSELLEHNAGLVTSSDVCSETLTHLRYNAGHSVALSFYRSLKSAQAQNRILIDWVSPAIFEKAWNLFQRYDDQVFSMVDCTSFIICKKRRIKTALTLDKHFIIMGFEAIPNPGSNMRSSRL